MAPLPDAILSLLPRSLQPRELSIASDLSKAALSPIEIYNLHRRSNNAAPVNQGSGSSPAASFNNQGFLALFALIGAGMVLGSIWFFFWAKNGGFHFRKGDWDDYKSTVLRRKGPDGKTLSNATRSTKLGGGSVVHGGSYGHEDATSVGYTDSTGYTDKDEMTEIDLGHGIRGGGGRTQRSGYKKAHTKDPELAEYRQEKVARVGGINRKHDGNYFDYSGTEPSDVSRAPLMQDKKLQKKETARMEKERKQSEKEALKTAAANAKKAKAEAKAAEKERKKEAAQQKKSKAPSSGPARPAAVVLAEANTGTQHRQVSGAYSYTAGDDNQTVYTGVYTAPYSDYAHSHAPSQSQHSYYDSYLPQNTRTSNTPPRTNSPRKPRIVQPSGEWASQADSDTGTKAYPCYIPGLSSADSVGVGDSVSQVGGRRERERESREYRSSGYRRSGRQRGDSLADSDGETRL